MIIDSKNLTDYEGIIIYSTDPLSTDTDGDGLSDSEDTNPLVAFIEEPALEVFVNFNLPDFNADGIRDVLWHNPDTWGNRSWTVNGTFATTNYLPKFLGADWAVMGVGDMSGDGKADILVRDLTTGDTQSWLMDGGTRTSTGYFTLEPVWEMR